MSYKVKEHFRKTKKGLVRVKESDRKDKAKKALLIGAGALTTLGLGALAYKRLGVKGLKTVISTKADDVAANKAKNITELVTPKKLKANYDKVSDPWLDDAITTVKSSKPLTVAKQEQKLLSGKELPKYDAPEYKPAVRPKKGFIKEDGSDQNLKQAITSQRTLVKREATDIKKKKKKLDLAKRYEASDSPALRRTGKSYRERANERLSIISKRSPDKTTEKLITVVGKKRKLNNDFPDPWLDNTKVTPLTSSTKISNKDQLLLAPGKDKPLTITKSPKPDVDPLPTKKSKSKDTAKKKGKSKKELPTDLDTPQSKSRRDLLKKVTNVKTIKQMQTKNPIQVIQEAGKDKAAIEAAGQETFDKINSVLSTKGNRRTAIKAGAKGAEGVVKGRIKRKIKGKLIARLTKGLRTGEFNPKNQSNAINRYKKLASKLNNANVPNTTRRQLLEAVEDAVVPGGSAAKKKKALEIYQRVLKEFDDMQTDTAIGATKSYVKRKTKNKQASKAAGIAAKLKNILTGGY